MTTPTTDSYVFSNSASEAEEQLACLQAYLDPLTTGVLDRVEVPPGGRCLEIGAGGGSIARLLAGRAGPTGRVVAVDLDPSRLTPVENVDVYQHDVRTGLPEPGPFDLIHARLVLLHLPQRRELLRQLAAALAPGGWLVLGEFAGAPPTILTSPTAGDAALYQRVMGALLQLLEQHGTDLGWAQQVHPAMVEAGLVRVHTVEYAESWTGGGPGIRLHYVNSRQKQAALLAAGITESELVRFRELVSDPRFCVRSVPFTCTSGQRPPA